MTPSAAYGKKNLLMAAKKNRPVGSGQLKQLVKPSLIHRTADDRDLPLKSTLLIAWDEKIRNRVLLSVFREGKFVEAYGAQTADEAGAAIERITRTSCETSHEFPSPCPPALRTRSARCSRRAA